MIASPALPRSLQARVFTLLALLEAGWKVEALLSEEEWGELVPWLRRMLSSLSLMGLVPCPATEIECEAF